MYISDVYDFDSVRFFIFLLTLVNKHQTTVIISTQKWLLLQNVKDSSLNYFRNGVFNNG
jgi:hypothetical protein